MKLALATLLFAAPAAAFVPSASFGAGKSAMYMSTEVETEEKVRFVFGYSVKTILFALFIYHLITESVEEL